MHSNGLGARERTSSESIALMSPWGIRINYLTRTTRQWRRSRVLPSRRVALPANTLRTSTLPQPILRQNATKGIGRKGWDERDGIARFNVNF
jgi:hypothetical protein